MKLQSQRSIKSILVLGVVTACGFGFAYGEQSDSTPVDPHRFGVGVNYWRALENIDVGDVDRDGFGYYLTYQYKPTLFGLGVDLEMLPDRFGSDAYAPQAYIIFGDVIYAGAGVGIVHTNDEFADDPFYSFRLGLDIPILPHFRLDIYGQYRFESRHDLRDDDTRIDTDTVFLGAAGRFVF